MDVVQMHFTIFMACILFRQKFLWLVYYLDRLIVLYTACIDNRTLWELVCQLILITCCGWLNDFDFKLNRFKLSRTWYVLFSDRTMPDFLKIFYKVIIFIINHPWTSFYLFFFLLTRHSLFSGRDTPPKGGRL